MSWNVYYQYLFTLIQNVYLFIKMRTWNADLLIPNKHDKQW